MQEATLRHPFLSFVFLAALAAGLAAYMRRATGAGLAGPRLDGKFD
jgi:hypothetical protein